MRLALVLGLLSMLGWAKEYATGYIHIPPHQRIHADYRKMRSDLQVPDSYDLRATNSAIMDQGSCGSCWAFSTTTVASDALIRAGKISQVL